MGSPLSISLLVSNYLACSKSVYSQTVADRAKLGSRGWAFDWRTFQSHSSPFSWCTTTGNQMQSNTAKVSIEMYCEVECGLSVGARSSMMSNELHIRLFAVLLGPLLNDLRSRFITPCVSPIPPTVCERSCFSLPVYHIHQLQYLN